MKTERACAKRSVCAQVSVPRTSCAGGCGANRNAPRFWYFSQEKYSKLLLVTKVTSKGQKEFLRKISLKFPKLFNKVFTFKHQLFNTVNIRKVVMFNSTNYQQIFKMKIALIFPLKFGLFRLFNKLTAPTTTAKFI